MYNKSEEIEVSIKLPKLSDEYEYTGEYRKAEVGEYFLYKESVAEVDAGICTLGEYFIIKKKEKLYRPLEVVFTNISGNSVRLLQIGMEEYKLFETDSSGWIDTKRYSDKSFLFSINNRKHLLSTYEDLVQEKLHLHVWKAIPAEEFYKEYKEDK